jgi:hypothetical protein
MKQLLTRDPRNDPQVERWSDGCEPESSQIESPRCESLPRYRSSRNTCTADDEVRVGLLCGV